MTNLTESTPRKFLGPPGRRIAWAAKANKNYFPGAALMKDASDGSAISCTPTANGEFLGFCVEAKNNLTGSVYGGTLASTEVIIEQNGSVELSVTRASGNWARTDSGTIVYASDDNTFTTDAGTNNIPIGRVHMVLDAAVGNSGAQTVQVAFGAVALRSQIDAT